MRKLFALATVLILFASCSKKDATASNIQGKWFIDHVTETEVFSGQTNTDDWSSPGDYFDFKSGSAFEGVFDGDPFTGTWSMGSGSTVVISNAQTGVSETMTIKSATSSNLVLYSKQGSSSDYMEITIYLNK